MSIIFAASEAAYLTGYPVSGSWYQDQNYSRNASGVGQSNAASVNIGTLLTPDSNGYWVSFLICNSLYRPNSYLTNEWFKLLDSTTPGGTGSVGLARGDPIKITKWTSAGYATFDSSYYYPRDNSRLTIRMHIFQDGADGRIKLYVGDTLYGDVTLTGETLRPFDHLFFAGPSNYASDTYGISEIIVADESLIGCRLRTAYVTGNGSETAWDGSYTDVDDIVHESTAITTTTDDAVSTFVHNKSITQNIRGVAVTAKASVGDNAGIDAVLRIGGVNYTKTPNGLLKKVPQTLSAVWTTNPATDSPFTGSDVSGLQFGVKKT